VVLEKKINPEISFDYVTLERFKSDEYRRVADHYSMRAYDHFSCTVHGFATGSYRSAHPPGF